VAVRRAVIAWRSASSLDRHQRRDDGLAPVDVGKPHQRRVDAAQLARRLENPAQQLVEVDRPRELAEDTVPAALFLRPLQRDGELPAELVHARVQAGDHVGDAFVGGGIASAADESRIRSRRTSARAQPRSQSAHSSSSPQRGPSA
jgi:hypothetical protein